MIVWCIYGVIGLTTVGHIVASAIINKKIPFTLIAIVLAVCGLLVFENNIPEKSNERDSSVDQIIITNDYINLRVEPDSRSNKLGIVEKNEIYTVLEIVNINGKNWFKIKTSYGDVGYIISGLEDDVYCELLPATK